MIPINELLSTPLEQHAFVVGIYHGWFFWRKYDCPDKFKGEEHYYGSGKIAGMIMIGLFQVFIGWLVKTVIL